MLDVKFGGTVSFGDNYRVIIMKAFLIFCESMNWLEFSYITKISERGISL